MKKYAFKIWIEKIFVLIFAPALKEKHTLKSEKKKTRSS
jgi:hypothetical protein